MPEVDAWLEQLGLGEYANVFHENGVDAELVPELTNDDLKDLGVSRLRDRKILLRAIAELKSASEGAVNESALRASAAERRQLTVMFCDLVGSVALSTQLDPEDLRELIMLFQDSCREAIRRYDGFIARYMGDGILVYFGFPVAREDSAERAVRAGLEIVNSMQQLNATISERFDAELAVRVGVATGPVVVGDIIGEGAAEQAAVVGETPNLAARLQSVAEPNQVIVAATTRQLLGALFAYEELGTHELKGIAEPVAVWRVVRERNVQSRFGAKNAGRRTPLIGRQDELDSLLARWEISKNSSGQMVLVGGEAGIGKSRICEALEDRLAVGGHHTIRMQCSPFRTNVALYPLTELVRHEIGVEHDDSSALSFTHLVEILSRYCEDDDSVARLLAPLLSVPIDEALSPSDASPAQRKRQTFDAALRILKAHSTARPLAIVIEDAHWIDPTSLELLSLIVANLREMRVLLVITHRPNFQNAWPHIEAVTCITLRRLRRQHVSELVDTLIGEHGLPRKQVEYILDKTDGIPLFIEELTQMLLSGADESKADRAGSAERHAQEIPTTIQDLLLERLDQLGAAKSLAQQAACFGRSFSRNHLSVVTGLSDAALQPKLERLKSSGLAEEIDEPGGHYQFKHALVQQAAYSSLLRNTRIDIHSKIALALEEELSSKAPEVLAFHFTEAQAFVKACDYWRSAGARSMSASAFVEASAHFSSALEQLRRMPQSPERDEQELLLLLKLGDPLVASRGFASREVSETFSRARELCQTLENIQLLFPVLWGLVSFYIVRSELEKAQELATQFLQLAESAGMNDLILTGNYLVGATYFWRGEFELALAPMENFARRGETEAELAFRIAPTENPLIDTLSYLSWMRLLMGHPDQSEAYSRQCLDLARSLGNYHDLAYALGYAAWLQQYRREYDKAHELAAELIALATEQELPFWLSCANILNGNWLVRHGHVEEGIEEIEGGFAIWRASGARLQKPSFLLVQAEAYMNIGQPEKSMELVEEALAALSACDRTSEVELLRFKGELLEKDDRPDEAERLYLEAIEVAGRQQARTLALRSTASLARLWRNQGKAAAARDRLRQVLESFDEGFDAPDLRDSIELLDELTHSPKSADRFNNVR